MAVLLGLASLLPLVIASIKDISDTRSALLESTGALLAARGDQLVHEIDSFNEGYQDLVAAFARLPRLASYCEDSNAERTHLAQEVLEVPAKADDDVRGLVIFDSHGVVVLATEPLVGRDLSNHLYVRRSIDEAKPQISDMHVVGEAPIVAYAHPIRVGCTLAVWVHAKALWSRVKASDALAGPNSFAVMFDAQGIRIAHTYTDQQIFRPAGRLDASLREELIREQRFGNDTGALIDDVRPLPQQFERARAAVPDTSVFLGYAPVNQQTNYGVGRRLRTTPWTLFYMVPAKHIDGQIAAFSRQKQLFAIAIIVLALVLGAVTASSILNPIRTLSSAARRIARGELDIRIPDIGRGDELGQLAKNFTAMESMFRDLLEAAPDAVVIREADGRIALVNRQVESVLGYRPSELIGQRGDIVIRSGKKPDLLARRKDGTLIPVEVSSSPLRTEKGSLLFKVIRDVSARQKAEEYRSRLAAIVSSSRDAIIGTDLDGTVTSWNEAAERIYGVDEADILGKNVALVSLEKITEPDAVPVFETIWKGAHLSISVAPVRNEQGEPVGLAAVARDVTALAKASEAAQHANRELESFSYSVAHDLRAPLRGMQGFARILLDQYADKLDADGKDALEEIVRNTTRMGELIEGLLALARVAQADLTREKIDLSDLARDVARRLQANVTVEEHLEGEGDPRLLRSLLDNLLRNAAKFTSKTTSPRIEVGRAGDAYFVRDNGAGFDMAHAQRLFVPFKRLHAESDFPGTGIGLATVSRIIERHGGKVWAEGVVGQGATFFFTLGVAS